MRRYHVTTFGCQMNVHDSERIKGMLESLGLGEAVSAEEADVIVFNTCTVPREPDQRFAAHLAQAYRAKKPTLTGSSRWAGATRRHSASGLRALSRRSTSPRPGSNPRPGRLARRRRHGRFRGRFAEWNQFAGDLPAHRERGSRRGCRSRWLQLVPARTASSRPSAAGSRAAGPATSSPRSRAWLPTGCAR